MSEAPDETAEKAQEPRPRESAASMPIPLPESLRPYGSVVKRVWAVVPWVSFILGAVGAYVMDRGPDQSWLIALGAIGVWITVLGLRFVSRYARPSMVGPSKAIAVAARISLILATQGLMQLSLFFALPFFFYASRSALDIGHGVFLLILSVMSLISLWDPLTEKLLKRPLLASALP